MRAKIGTISVIVKYYTQTLVTNCVLVGGPEGSKPTPHATTMLAYGLHIGGGTLGLLSGTVAAFAAKGSNLHRRAGTIFFVSVLTMAAFAALLAIAIPGQFFNLIGRTYVIDLGVTAWMTVRRPEGAVGLPEKIAFVVVFVLCVPFALLAFQLGMGLPPFVGSAVAFEGPILIAVYAFTFLVVFSAVTDAKVILDGGISGVPRIARHLWRMCLALTMATGSAFTNGLPRLLPGPMHVTTIYFLPQLVPLAVLAFWMIRVRLSGWRNGAAAAQARPSLIPDYGLARMKPWARLLLSS